MTDNIQNPEAFQSDPLEEGNFPPIIKVIGVGGGGCNAANYLFKQGIENVTFLVCNTDMHSLRKLQIPNRIILGYDITHGLGAGDNPELGSQAAEASREEIRRELGDDTRMVFITAGMGGGTGTGAAPIVAQVAQEMGILTVGIVTIPFFFEGERKILKALKGAEEMRKHVDTLLIVVNERLTEIYPDLNLLNAFEKADDTLANATRSIAEIINTNGYINADFNDVKTTLQQSSTAIISTGYGEGEHRVTNAIQDALHSPLLRNADIKSSKRLLFYLYFNPKAKNVVSMAEMNEITQFSANLNPKIDVKWGNCFDESLGEGVKMTILASGFDITISEGSADKEGKGVGSGSIIFPAAPGKEDTRVATPAEDINAARTKIEDQYGPGKMADHEQAMARAKYVVLKPSQFDDDEVIYLFEKNPAYGRDIRLKDHIRSIGQGVRTENDAAAKAAERSTDSPAESGSTITF
ncbi:MAG: cell division protein FtsZ [Bacteroidales bacterium]|nr:cell division protein FtsZ [Bacteroidales bacterium]